MLSLFDQFTTKKPQFDAYPFLNQSVIQRWKGTRWKIKNLICSDEIGVVRWDEKVFCSDESGLVLTDTDLFGRISYFCDKLSFCLDEYFICYDE